MWRGIAGIDFAVERFRRALERGRLASTYLFVGPQNIGKAALATELSRSLLCLGRHAGEIDPCDRCPSCRALDAGAHPDFLQVAKPADRSSLPISLLLGARERRGREGLCHDLSLRPALSGRRVALLNDSDTMDVESANCLLKTLEEPPAGSVLILIAENEARVLPTIRSRCQVFRFQASSPSLDTAAGEGDEESGGLLDEETRATLLRGLAAKPLDPAGLYRGLEHLTRTLGADDAEETSEAGAASNAGAKEPRANSASARRGRLRAALHEATQFYRGEVLAHAAANQHSTSPCDAALGRLAATLEAEEALDRNANAATLLQSWLEGLSRAEIG